jgi:hypothetical protein
MLGPDPHGMDPKIGPKIGPGRILIKPEALLRDLEYNIESSLKQLLPLVAIFKNRRDQVDVEEQWSLEDPRRADSSLHLGTSEIKMPNSAGLATVWCTFYVP